VARSLAQGYAGVPGSVFLIAFTDHHHADARRAVDAVQEEASTVLHVIDSLQSHDDA
jgi:NAD/NADP transhydrogenase beta subunit